jgi:hypothetical protein
MSAWPKSQFLDDYQDSLVSCGGRSCRHPPSLPVHKTGSGAWTSGLRDPSGFNLLGANLNPHKMNGQQVGQLQRVTTRSQRKVAGASRGTRGLWTGFQSRFFSDQGPPTIKLIPTPWAS